MGLVQYMLQLGLLIPCGDESEAGVFEDIFLDIGDEQSLENDLSTYSSHLLAMKQFLLLAGKKSLVLIDEFGTGTEPSLGGAIAEAVLDAARAGPARYGVITTHYTNLKNFAERTPAPRERSHALRPRAAPAPLPPRSGQAGLQSFAIEIARKSACRKDVVERATAACGQGQNPLRPAAGGPGTAKKPSWKRRTAEAAKQERRLKKAAQEYAGPQAAPRGHAASKPCAPPSRQAKALLRDTNQQIEATIGEIRRGQADKEINKLAREKLDTFVRKELHIEPPKPKATRELAGRRMASSPATKWPCWARTATASWWA
ncbi:MAG: hypothetical protein WKG07_29025 [Hymenobacter sp.]